MGENEIITDAKSSKEKTQVNRKTSKISKGLIAGYSTAGFGMGAAATLFYAFFLYFLTTVAGFDPAIGAVVIFVAVLWDGFTDPTMGYLSDRCRSKYGKRRPFILAGAIPLGICTALMLTDVSFVGGTGKLVYMLGINMAFWLFFTMSDIPWAALGSELTEDFNEKTKIRTVSSTMVQIGMFAAFAGIPLLAGFGGELFGGEAAGWSFAGAVTGVVVTITYLFSWNATRGAEPVGDQIPMEEPPEKESILKQFAFVVRNKPMRYLVGLTLFMVMTYSGIWAATLMFMIRFNLGVVEEARQAMFLSVWGASAIFFTPVVGWLSTRFSKTLGKAKTLGYAVLVTVVTLFTVKLMGLTPATMVILMLGISFGHSAFWLFVYVLAYDVGTVETYVTGENKDGTVVSVMSFTLKLAMGLGMALGGVLLSMYGFDENAAVQTQATLAGIESIFFTWGGCFILLGAILCFKFPVTQQKYEAIKQATKKKAAGQPYSEEAFADLL